MSRLTEGGHNLKNQDFVPNQEFYSLSNSFKVLSQDWVNKYYSILLGKFDGLEYDLSIDIKALFSNLQSFINSPKISQSFTFAQNDNNLNIFLSAYQQVSNLRDVDCIIGLSTGGTHPSMAIKALYKILGDKDIRLDSLVYSKYGAKKTFKNGSVEPIIVSDLEDYSGLKCLIIDDNILTGESIKKAYQALLSKGASKLFCRVVELDLHRIMLGKRCNQGVNLSNIIDLSSDLASKAVGIVPILRSEKWGGWQLRKIAASKLSSSLNTDVDNYFSFDNY